MAVSDKKKIVLALHAGVVLLITGFIAWQMTAIVYMGRYSFNNPDIAGIYAIVNESEGMYGSYAEL